MSRKIDSSIASKSKKSPDPREIQTEEKELETLLNKADQTLTDLKKINRQLIQDTIDLTEQTVGINE